MGPWKRDLHRFRPESSTSSSSSSARNLNNRETQKPQESNRHKQPQTSLRPFLVLEPIFVPRSDSGITGMFVRFHLAQFWSDRLPLPCVQRRRQERVIEPCWSNAPHEVNIPQFTPLQLAKPVLFVIFSRIHQPQGLKPLVIIQPLGNIMK